MARQEEKCSVGLLDANINDLLKLIMQTMVTSIVPLVPIPPVLLYMGAKMRGGMSAIEITERALNKMSDAGIPVGPINGEDNLTAIMTESIIGELTHSIKTEGKVEVAYGPGDMAITGVGANAGGPVVVNSYNTSFSSANGVMS